ncbi:alpha-L-rhamnosidase N-terminal domain-containing protein [Umezawaea sp. Da 62-37]|uniref:alpha-L-rhamnosidase N-terminal domain-containing protein n=1 Tax=Umezawaea sp. Da 62-37 TaxID=3075927 RepID=UPI0028F6F9E9|nr:alpha-L-rhamnosidase N-terminal domain-containing protein [Umezawaea sp. Da 62-37]WNV85988.1 alpha-L-rhamnosidase N-terminal domain-containing protein [Umezawaea sp. Da 62-37]
MRVLDAGEVVWTSGRRESAESVLVDLGVDRRGGSWQVRVRTDLGESDWSEPAPWPVDALPAVLDTATWIEPHEPVIPAPGERPAYRLRHGFTLDGPVTAATAWATAHGIYELFVNGTRVGDQELTPGFTAYRRRLQVQRYDVADLLRVGANSVEVLLSDGWFRGRHGFERTADGFGDRVAALLALEVAHDGGTTVVTTGPDWRSRPSRVTAADLMDGQRVDFRTPEADWHPAHPVDGGLYADRGRLVLTVAPPVRRIEELTPTVITGSRAAASWWTSARTSTAGSG